MDRMYKEKGEVRYVNKEMDRGKDDIPSLLKQERERNERITNLGGASNRMTRTRTRIIRNYAHVSLNPTSFLEIHTNYVQCLHYFFIFLC